MNESKQILQIHKYFRSYLLLFVNMFLILTYSNKTSFIRIGKQLKKVINLLSNLSNPSNNNTNHRFGCK